MTTELMPIDRERTGTQPKIDCHAHIIDPTRFPYENAGGYIPKPSEEGDASDFADVMARNGVTHGLLVQPSCYGFHNAAMLDAIGKDKTHVKGIAVVHPSTERDEIADLRGHGVVGIRLNIGTLDPELLERPETGRLLQVTEACNWFVQVYAAGDKWTSIAPVVKRLGRRLVIDHLGHPDTRANTYQAGFRAVCDLGRSTDALIKLSGFFRVANSRYPYADIDPFADAILETFGSDRCLWGSDWPFLDARFPVHYEEELAALERWVPSSYDREKILFHNPTRYFGF